MRHVTSKKLQNLAQEFAQWRRRKQRRTEPIPDVLWSKASKLAERLGPDVVAKQLRLSSRDFEARLKKRRGQGRAKHRNKKLLSKPVKARVIKLAPIVVDAAPSLAAPGGGILEIEGPYGWRFRAASQDGPALLKALAEAYR